MTRITSVRPRSTRWLRAAMAVATLLALVLCGAGLGAAPSATPRLDWVFDGPVRATARIGNTLYVGGNFTRVMPSSGALGSLFALSPTSGAVVPTNFQALDFVPSAVEPDGAGGYFLAGFGNFGTTGAIVHTRADGSLDPAFQPPPGSLSSRMLRVGSTLFVGGFGPVNGVARAIVALDTSTGALLPFAPMLPAGAVAVWSLAADGNRLFLLTVSAYGLGGQLRYVTAVDVASGAPLWQSDVTGAPVESGSGALRMVGGRLIAGIGRLYSLDPATGVVDPAWAAGQVPAASILTIASSAQTIYVGGTFSTFHGQPRARLAAVDAATGALLPWSPQASGYVQAMAVSPTGTVFVGASSTSSGSVTINGLVRGVFEIDATGAVTPFTPQAPIETAELLHFTPAGSLLVGASGVYLGRTSRASLAAFDLTSGALLPEAPTLGGPFPFIDELASAGQTLYLRGRFDTLNGQTRAGVGAVDVSSGTVLPWPAPGLSVYSFGPIEGTSMYATVSTSPSNALLRRLHTVTGAIDPSWTPTLGGQVFADRGELLFITGLLSPTGVGSVGSRVGVLDRVTGQFREWLRTQPGLFITRLIPDGGTVYVLGGDPNNIYHPLDVGRTLYAIDRATGVPVWRPPLAGRINGAAVVDGRVIVGGRNLAVGGVARYGSAETTRTGQLTGWSAGFAPYGPDQPLGPPGGVDAVTVHGDVLAITGSVAPNRSRVAVFDLLGSAAPSGLRSRAAAGVVEFSWDPPAIAPGGGYVIEGGFVPGQVAATIPVGSGTTFTTPVSVVGPAFIRVRGAGGAEVSNEIVAGCVAPPLPPTALTTTISGTTLSLAWSAPLDAVTSYVFSAGTASGLSDAATTTLPASLTSIGGTVPGGTFFVRVQAANACGTSGPSGEVFFTIGAQDPLPAAPTNLAASVSGSTVSLTWTAPAGPVTGYVLEGGTALGLANIGALRVGAITSFAIPGAPPGVYAVRVRAITSAGSGAPSADVLVVVP